MLSQRWKVCVLIVCIGSLLWSSGAMLPPTTSAAGADVPHCTDSVTATQRDSTTDQDQVSNDYETFVYLNSFTLPRPRVPLTVVPQGTGADWHVLVRPDQPFAVFYTEDPTSPDAIDDLDSTGANYDVDSDGVPDYAERVYHCLTTSYERYKAHYAITDGQEGIQLKYMSLEYLDLATGNRVLDTFYPVIIRNEGRRGLVAPLMLTNSLAPINATYMHIDQNSDPARGITFPRDSMPWLYPSLENIIYHEMAHVVQGLYVGLARPWDLQDWWVYEGTAVYMTDQSLLPTCTSDTLNPVRIAGLAFPLDCRAPNIYERDSEERLSTNTQHLFREPWRGLTRDELNPTTSEMAYSTVLFWYYIQAHLRAHTNSPDDDIVRHFWKDHGGNDSVAEAWAASAFPDGGWAELYHRFMIDNYLQTVPAPDGFDNPYFDAWQHWRTWSGSPWTSPDWFVQTNSQIAIESQDQLVSLLPNSTDVLSGDNGISDIDYFGTRYYTIDPDPSAPLTSTLELNVFFDEPFAYRGYQMTLLDMQVDPTTKESQAVLDSINLTEIGGGLARIPNFSGADRRLVVVASKVAPIDQNPFTINAALSTTGTVPTMSPNPFSPNGDERNDETTITYFLPAYTTAPGDHQYEVDLRVVADGVPDRRILRALQPVSQTQVISWTGMFQNSPSIEDGEHVLQIEAQEQPDGGLPGQVRVYTTTFAVDTVAPPTVTNLSIVTDTLTWDVVTDTSVGGFEYVIFESLNLTDSLRGMTRLGQTTSDSFRVGTTSSSRYYAVVTEDAAGNRSAPARTETVAGKVNVAIIVDDSNSMSLAKLQEGVAATSDFIANLEDGDRLALRDVADSQPHMSFTIMDSTTRQEGQDTLAAYASHQPTGSPMDEAVTWALEEFDSPDVANDGRPRVLIIFSDSDWELEDAERTALKDADVRVFAVHVPAVAPDWAGSAYGGELRALVTATSDSDTDSRFYNEDDLDEVYRDITRRLRYELVDVDSESVPPGATRTFDYPIDTRTREKTIRVRWDSGGPPPEVELTDPNGTRITPSSLIRGVLYSVSAGESVYTLNFPPRTPGLWQLHVTNPTPVLRSDQASLDDAGMDVTIETQTDNTVTSHLQLTDQMTLTLDLLDEGQPLSRNTMVWADLVDVQGITETVVLYDDGQHGDGAAQDGRFGASLDGVVREGGYTAYIGVQSFDQEHGYFERIIEEDLYVENPHADPMIKRVRWKDIDGNQDSAVDPGETIRLWLDLQNVGDHPKGVIEGSLQLISGTATLSTTTSPYPYLFPESVIDANRTPYTFIVDSTMPEDGELVFAQVVTTTKTYTNTFRVPLGVQQLGDTITYTSDQVPLDIPDYGRGRLKTAINIPEDATFAVGDLDVSLDITHPNIEELGIDLEAPQDRLSSLIERPPNGGANMIGTRLDDEASQFIMDGTAPFTGRFYPEAPLGFHETITAFHVLDGGRWWLQIRDRAQGQIGTLDHWALHVRPLLLQCGLVANGSDPCIRFATTTAQVDEGEVVWLTIELSNPAPQSTEIRYVTKPGTARSRDDFELQDGRVYFGPGETRKTIGIATFTDTRSEADETFTVQLEGFAGKSNILYGDTSQVNITIRDQSGE